MHSNIKQTTMCRYICMDYVTEGAAFVMRADVHIHIYTSIDSK